jgi:hypothetical protein
MFHPLGPNLKDLSTEELHKKYNELLTRYNQAFKFGPHGVLNQLQMLLNDYQLEIQTRNQKQIEEMEKASKNFKNIIDIK